MQAACLSFFIFLSLLYGLSEQAEATSVDVPGSITILTPVGITVNSNGSFGKILPGNLGSTVSLSSSGMVTVTSGDASIIAQGQGISFSITGTNGYSVSISYNASTLADSNGHQMSMGPPSMPPPSSCIIGTNCNNLSIQPTLSVPANQAAGNYSGTMTITANYQ